MAEHTNNDTVKGFVITLEQAGHTPCYLSEGFFWCALGGLKNAFVHSVLPPAHVIKDAHAVHGATWDPEKGTVILEDPRAQP